MDKNLIANKIYEIITLYKSFNNSKIKPKIKKKNFCFESNKIQKEILIEDSILTHSPLDFQIKEIKNEKIKKVPPHSNEKKNQLLSLTDNIFKCNLCNNQQIKNKRIPGVGNLNAKIMVILPPQINTTVFNEKPLTEKVNIFFLKWLNAIDLSIENIFLTNITKCYFNNISKENINNCRNFLDSQLKIFNPQLMLVLGQISISSLQQKHTDLNKFHGKVFYYNKIPYMATYDPELVMSQPALKKIVWEDLKKLKGMISKLSLNNFND